MSNNLKNLTSQSDWREQARKRRAERELNRAKFIAQSDDIIKVDIAVEPESKVATIADLGYKTVHDSDDYFDTFIEAKEHLLIKAEHELKEAIKAFQEAQKRYNKIFNLEEHEA